MKKKTPFKAPEDFEKELMDFSNQFRMTLAEHSKRISDYFEMTCYNLIILYYEKHGYELTVQNLKGGKFKYKCSPTREEFFIFHNATVQSAFDDLVFTTPDIVVSRTSEPKETTDYYVTKLRKTYISKDNLISFCEVKHYMPFPELMLNFMGIVHELKPECTDDHVEYPATNHIAPSLMMSGSLGKSTKRIKESLERRYYVNFIDNLFEDATIHGFLTKSQLEKTATLSKKREKNSPGHKKDSTPDILARSLPEIEH